MKKFNLSHVDAFPKSIAIKNHRDLSELSIKIMQLSLEDNDADVTLSLEDNCFMQSALEVYARWLDAHDIIDSKTGTTHSRQQEALSLLNLRKSKNKIQKDSALRHAYLCEIGFSANPSQAMMKKAVLTITEEFNYQTVDACLSALQRASIKNGGMQQIKLPSKSSMDYE